MQRIRTKLDGLPRGRDLMAILLTVWLLGCTAFQYHPRTPFGVQCPTAPVQAVPVAVRDCCDRVIGYKYVAPKPSEPTFVQCRCAESKTALEIGLPPRLEPFFPPSVHVEFPPSPPHPWVAYDYSERITAPEIPPSVRPPAEV